jgi:hypothetical protein
MEAQAKSRKPPQRKRRNKARWARSVVHVLRDHAFATPWSKGELARMARISKSPLNNAKSGNGGDGERV